MSLCKKEPGRAQGRGRGRDGAQGWDEEREVSEGEGMARGRCGKGMERER